MPLGYNIDSFYRNMANKNLLCSRTYCLCYGTKIFGHPLDYGVHLIAWVQIDGMESLPGRAKSGSHRAARVEYLNMLAGFVISLVWQPASNQNWWLGLLMTSLVLWGDHRSLLVDLTHDDLQFQDHIHSWASMPDPSSAKAIYFRPKYKEVKIFENDLSPVVLVFIG